MLDQILLDLHALRIAARRSTLLCTVALAAGVVMIPLSYRGGVNPWDRWVLLGAVLTYVAVGALRVSRGLRLERQLESEVRLVRATDREGLSTTLKIGRPSSLFQAIHGVREVDPPERRHALRVSLRKSLQRMAIPPASASVPVLVVTAGLWGRFALVHAEGRFLPLLVAVLVVLTALLICESSLLHIRRRTRREHAALVDDIVQWWILHQQDADGSPFRHQVLYRDVAERLGLS